MVRSPSKISSATSLREDISTSLQGDVRALSRVVAACSDEWAWRIALTMLFRVIDVPVGGASAKDWKVALPALRMLEALVGTWPDIRSSIAPRTALIRRLAATAPFALPPGSKARPPPRPTERTHRFKTLTCDDTLAQCANFQARAAVRERAERVLLAIEMPHEVRSQTSEL
eukprot:6949925-Prymnesium_polylepis.1